MTLDRIAALLAVALTLGAATATAQTYPDTAHVDVIPAQGGNPEQTGRLDSRLRGNDVS